MARTSRKFNGTESVAALEQKNIYNTAIYTRLSVEDKKEQSNSIEGQISIITAFINENPDMCISNIYADNGFSGANFNRPQFIQMMEDVRNGKINCIAVKDLSRLGRAYLEVMDYIEQVFPMLNVRFISVNDHIDTFSPLFDRESLLIALKSLVNHMYLQDISDKINASFKTMREKGWFVGAVPPYGFLKSPEDKHKLIVDEEAAQTVKQIFEWALQGIPKRNIAKRLNENGIAAPRNYFYQLGIVKDEKYSKTIYWQDSVISHILENQVYIGNMAGGKTNQKNGVKTRQGEDKQTIVEGTHEAIIQKEDFYKVRELLAEIKQNYKSMLNKPVPFEKPPIVFKKVGYCGECGRKLSTNFGKKVHKYSASYVCPYCNTHTDKRVAFSFSDLEKAVLETMKGHIASIADFKCIIEEINKQPQQLETAKQLQTQISGHQTEAKKLKTVLEQIYLDYSDGVITADEYTYTKNKYGKKLSVEENVIRTLSDELDRNTDRFVNNSNLNSIAEKYRSIDRLDSEIVENIIEKVEVYSGRKMLVTFKFADEFKVYEALAGQGKAVVSW